MRIRRAWAVTATAMAVLLGVAASPMLPATAEALIPGAGLASAVPDQYIVVLKDSASVSTQAATLNERYQGTLRYVFDRAPVGFSTTMSEEQALRLAADPAVAYVEQDQRIKVAGTEEDPPWGLDRIDQRDLPLDAAYTYPSGGTIGSLPVTAYILDSGIRISHSDFGGRASYGRDFVDGDNEADDCHGHGTSVASIVGGDRHGVAKKVRLVAVRIFDCQGLARGDAVIAAINWLAANVVRPAVVNFSGSLVCVDEGGRPAPCANEANRAIRQAIFGSILSGIPWVAAAGDLNRDGCQELLPGIASMIAVGATTATDAKLPSSNRGDCVQFYAPGDRIPSAGKASDTAVVTLTGTSAATAHVTGAVAMLMGQSGWGSRTAFEVGDELANNWTIGDKVTGLNPSWPNHLLHTKPPPAVGGSSIAAARHSDGRLDVYGVTPDGMLEMRTQSTPNEDEWGVLTFAKTSPGWHAISAHNDRDVDVELFGVGRKDRVLWGRTRMSSAGPWTTWYKIPGEVNAAGLATQPNNRIEAFATTDQGRALHASQRSANPRDITAWEDFGLGDTVLRGITAEVNGNQLIEVFTLTKTGEILHRWQTAVGTTTYTPWVPLDGVLKALAVTRDHSGRLVLVGVDPDGRVKRRTALPGTNTWSSWTEIFRTSPVGTVGTLTSLAAAAHADGRIAVFGVNTLGEVWHTRQEQAGSTHYIPWLRLAGLYRP